MKFDFCEKEMNLLKRSRSEEGFVHLVHLPLLVLLGVVLKDGGPVLPFSLLDPVTEKTMKNNIY